MMLRSMTTVQAIAAQTVDILSFLHRVHCYTHMPDTTRCLHLSTPPPRNPMKPYTENDRLDTVATEIRRAVACAGANCPPSALLHSPPEQFHFRSPSRHTPMPNSRQPPCTPIGTCFCQPRQLNGTTQPTLAPTSLGTPAFHDSHACITFHTWNCSALGRAALAACRARAMWHL